MELEPVVERDDLAVTALAGLFAVVVLGLVAAVVVAGVVAIRSGKASFERDSRLAPGLSTSAPTSWAGSHDPEARLHRRLRDALAALTANQAFDDSGHLLDLRVELEQQAVALDEQLVATAALPLHVRREPLETITGAVETIERAVAELAGASATEASARLDRALADVRDRTSLVAQARRALDELDASTPGEPGAPDPSLPQTSPPQTSPPQTSPPQPGPAPAGPGGTEGSGADGGGSPGARPV